MEIWQSEIAPTNQLSRIWDLCLLRSDTTIIRGKRCFDDWREITRQYDALFWLGALTIFFVMLKMINVILVQPRNFYSQVVRVRLNLFSELTHVGMERLRIGI